MKSQPTGDHDVLRGRIRHLPESDAARFHRPAAGAGAGSAIDDPHRRRSLEPVPSDCGLGLVPTHSFADCPPLDLLCVPGGGVGVIAAASDRATIDFVRSQARQARYVTSVCTGAFILGVAGLLRGRRATTHWAFTDLLPLVGATHQKARVVKDGNLITAGGVTSGIDFGLSVVAEIADERAARTIQLGIEYDPAPLFDSGHPDRAPAAIRTALLGCYEKARSALRAG